MYRFSCALGALFFLAVFAYGEEKKQPAAPAGTWTLRRGGHLVTLTFTEKRLTWGSHTTGDGSAEISANDYSIGPDNLVYGFVSSIVWDNKDKPIGKNLIPVCFRIKLDEDDLHVSDIKGPFDKDGETALTGTYQRSRYTR